MKYFLSALAKRKKYNTVITIKYLTYSQFIAVQKLKSSLLNISSYLRMLQNSSTVTNYHWFTFSFCELYLNRKSYPYFSPKREIGSPKGNMQNGSSNFLRNSGIKEWRKILCHPPTHHSGQLAPAALAWVGLSLDLIGR